VAKTKELKRRSWGMEEVEESQRWFLKESVSRERLFLSARV